MRRRILQLWKRVSEIAEHERGLQKLSDSEIRAKTESLRRELAAGKTLGQILVPAFAVCREAAARVLKKRPFDVQVMGGIALHEGRIVEMKAGEGKTLTVTMPVYLNALLGRGVHIVTTNDYLARRDAEWMGSVYEFLGLSVGVVTQEMEAPERRENYARDITYVTNQEVGFDYLRDNLVMDPSERVLRDLNFAIVDEADSILIDEARTPLIIAELVAEPEELFRHFAELVRGLAEDRDFVVDYETKTVELTPGGEKKVEEALGLPLFQPEYAEYVFFLDTALKARTIFERDRDYMVSGDPASTSRGEAGGEVIIVDEFTGRPMPGRRFMDGIHQAIEAKEGVRIREKDRVVASITFQNFFKLYGKLSGMTGTGWSAREEFRRVYEVDGIVIPTNRPLKRDDMDDVFYKTKRDKFLGIARDVQRRHKAGQPVLIGTRSIEVSEEVSAFLREASIPHQILNAKSLEAEAEEIARAGNRGIVTVATNMAGRGTDILLAGGVAAAGGLHVIGTERHQARRIDDQLRGRAGRQGDAGSSQFHVSAEDELMLLFAPELVVKAMEHLQLGPGEGMSAPRLTKALFEAQAIVESRDFDTRFYLLQYDRILDKQRVAVYKLRDKYLLGADAALKASVLPLLDRLWQDHLVMMEELQDEGSLLSYAQKDPFVEFALEARKLFQKMMEKFYSELKKVYNE